MMQKDGKVRNLSAGCRQKRIPCQHKITPRSNFLSNSSLCRFSPFTFHSVLACLGKFEVRTRLTFTYGVRFARQEQVVVSDAAGLIR